MKRLKYKWDWIYMTLTNKYNSWNFFKIGHWNGLNARAHALQSSKKRKNCVYDSFEKPTNINLKFKWFV